MHYLHDNLQEEWCIELIPGSGDQDPAIVRTRAFMLNNQCGWGYFGAFTDHFAQGAIQQEGCYDRAHWSDPIYFAC